MRRGETARVFDECGTLRDVYSWFLTFLRQLASKAANDVAPDDPTVEETRAAVASCIALCEEGLAESSAAASFTTGERMGGLLLLLAAGAFFYRAWGMGGAGGAPLLGSGPLLPVAGADGLEKYLSLVLLAACAMRAVAVR
jgi:hypothetical protein